MKKIKRILVGVGDEKTLNSCLDVAIPIASSFNASITAVYVMPPFPRTFMQALHSPRKKPETEAKKVLEKVEKRCEKSGVTCQKKLLKGYPKDQILKTVPGYDLVVLGRANFGSKLLGSVSSAVAQHSNTNVLLVK